MMVVVDRGASGGGEEEGQWHAFPLHSLSSSSSSSRGRRKNGSIALPVPVLALDEEESRERKVPFVDVRMAKRRCWNQYGCQCECEY